VLDTALLDLTREAEEGVVLLGAALVTVAMPTAAYLSNSSFLVMRYLTRSCSLAMASSRVANLTSSSGTSRPFSRASAVTSACRSWASAKMGGGRCSSSSSCWGFESSFSAMSSKSISSLTSGVMTSSDFVGSGSSAAAADLVSSPSAGLGCSVSACLDSSASALDESI
jgi:hypothetical protein